MRIPSGVTDQVIFFVAVDSTDLKTRKTGLSGFAVYRARDTGAATAMTTPTVTELSAANMPGVYSLLLDEDMTIAAGNDSEEMVFHITVATMAPVTRSIELYRPKITAGETITAANGAADADIERLQGSLIATPTVAGVLEVDVTHWIGTAAATPTVAGVPEVDITHFGGTAGTFAAGRPEVNTTHAAGTAWNSGAITTGTFTAGAINAAAIAADAIGASELAADAVAEIADAVWDEDATAHQTGGTFGQAIGDPGADTNTIFKAVVTDATGATVGVDVVAIQADTDDIQTRLPAALVGGRMDSSVGAMAANVITAASTAADYLAEVNAEVVDALSVDTYSEPTGVPSATDSLASKIGRVHQALRNQITVTSTKKIFYDDAVAALWEKDLSDDGTTYTETEGNAP